jgi:hypothetical protein
MTKVQLAEGEAKFLLSLSAEQRERGWEGRNLFAREFSLVSFVSLKLFFFTERLKSAD